MKKEVKKGLEICMLFFLSLTIVLAAHVITTSTGTDSFSVAEDVGFIYNITVNNTDPLHTNISEVNITFPDIFTFILKSNGTDAGAHTFTNTTTVLSWNSVNLVYNFTFNYFWFNATASTPGIYNLSVFTTNASGTQNTNITITINDTTDPESIEFVLPSESNNSNISRLNVIVNVTAIDNGAIDTIMVRLMNSTKNQVNYSTSSTSPLYVNFTGVSEGTYYFNATVNDTFGNTNSTSTRNITIDTTSPVIALIAPTAATSATTAAYNFTFNVTDTYPISSCNLILDNSISTALTNVNNTGGTNGIYKSSISIAAHTWGINCTDLAGNIGNSSIRTLTVTAATTTSSSGGTSSPTLKPAPSKLEEGYKVSLPENWRVQFIIAEETHSLTVDDISSTKVYITIRSDPQKANLSVGEEKKFDITGDDVYDLLVKVESIENLKATLLITTISESLTEEEIIEKEEAEAADADEAEKSLTWLWILIGVIVVLILIGAGYKVKHPAIMAIEKGYLEARSKSKKN